MTTEFIFVSNEEGEEGEPFAYSGFRSKIGRIYLLDNAPAESFKIRVKGCASKLYRFKLGLGMDNYYRDLRKVASGELPYL